MRLSIKPATTAMKSTIHALKNRARMDDDTYRDLLEQQVGVRSSRDLTVAQASRVIDRLKVAAGDVPGAITGLDTPVGAKLRALWITGYNCAVVRDRTDRAMLAFLERQTGVSHIRFLQQPGDSARAIEGLKTWIGREAGIGWPDSDDDIGTKRAVLDAQWQKLIDLGEVKQLTGNTNLMSDLEAYACRIVRLNRWEGFKAHHLDDVQAALGRKLRGAMMRRAQATEG